MDEMFFQVPEILQHHQVLFASLKGRLEDPDASPLIGDILLNFVRTLNSPSLTSSPLLPFQFTKQSVIDTYTSFMNNWKNAKRAIRRACQTKPAFAKYLVVRAVKSWTQTYPKLHLCSGARASTRTS